MIAYFNLFFLSRFTKLFVHIEDLTSKNKTFINIWIAVRNV